MAISKYKHYIEHEGQVLESTNCLHWCLSDVTSEELEADKKEREAKYLAYLEEKERRTIAKAEILDEECGRTFETWIIRNDDGSLTLMTSRYGRDYEMPVSSLDDKIEETLESLTQLRELKELMVN